MRRYDHPADPANPYPGPGPEPGPDAPTEVTGFRYRSALLLFRAVDAVKLRDGEDADYILAADYLCAWADAGGAWHELRVPRGLITDLASVPRPFRWIVGRVGPWLEAAIVHDYLYIAWQDVPGRGARPEDRRFADAVMRAAMVEARVSPLLVWAIHLAVRLFGAGIYAAANDRRYLDLDEPELAGQVAASAPRSG